MWLLQDLKRIFRARPHQVDGASVVSEIFRLKETFMTIQTSNESVVNMVAEDASHWVIKSVLCTLQLATLVWSPLAFHHATLVKTKRGGLWIGLIILCDPIFFIQLKSLLGISFNFATLNSGQLDGLFSHAPIYYRDSINGRINYLEENKLADGEGTTCSCQWIIRKNISESCEKLD